MEEREELLRELPFTPINYNEHVKNYWDSYYQKYNAQIKQIEADMAANYEMLMSYIKK